MGGDAHRSDVIGYPVMYINGSAYVVGFGGGNFLVISPVQIRDYYTDTINGLLGEWAGGQARVNPPGILTLNLINDPSYTDEDPCSITQGYLSSNNWLFSTGEQVSVSPTKDVYILDYCVLGAVYHPGEGDTIAVNYIGFNNIEINNSNPYGNVGEFRRYDVGGINMTTALSIDSKNGYNSYMTWSGAPSAAEPGNTACSWFSYSDLELVISLAQGALEYLFEAATAADPSQPIASLTSSQTITGPGSGATSNLVWSIGVENPNLFCSPESTRTGGIYPVGFGLTDFQGAWQINPSITNTAASPPVFFGGGTICYPPITDGYVEEAFGGSAYFVLQYDPGGSPQIGLISAQYPTPPYTP